MGALSVTSYDPTNWYWNVGGNLTQAYSSASGNYVPANDATFQAWVASGGVPTQIDTEANLGAVLAASSAIKPVASGVLAGYVAAMTGGQMVQVNSASTPALSGLYAFDVATQGKMLAVSLYISVNGKFPAGQTALPFPDAAGAMRSFTSPAQFQAFATALADYATALAIGQTPTAPLTIP